MKNNRTLQWIFAVLFAGAALPLSVQAVDTGAAAPVRLTDSPALTWSTDLPKAQARAKAEGKFVLLFFHGSDWCPPCVEMQRQVIDSAAFAEYARRALVLVDVDFPENHPQSEDLKRTHLALKARFNLSRELGEGFPTIVLLNPSGETVFQETGYEGGGAAEFLSKLQRHAGSPVSTTDSTGFKNLTVDEFAALAGDKRNVVLDVRTAREFNAGHLLGAVNLDVNAVDFAERAAALDKSKVYLVHCASGVRSVRACAKLARLDFHSLYNLPGGYKAWVKAGRPVEK